MNNGNRDVREIVRDELLMREPILNALSPEPLTVPQLAAAIDRPAHEVMFWVMGLRRYGLVKEGKDMDDDGYYHYHVVERRAS